MKNYNNDETFLARWLNDDLTEEELLEFQNSKDFSSFKKIADLSSKFEMPKFEQEKVKNEIIRTIDNKTEVLKPTNVSKGNQIADVNTEKSIKKVKVLPLFSKIAIAASLAILFTFIGFQFWSSNTTTVVTNYGVHKTFMLPDGSKVELNSNSELSFLEKDWSNGDRKLTLKGEAFFTVQKGSKFRVFSNQGMVQVVGTKFNVKTLDNYYAVECYEGKVLVKKNKEESLLTSGTGVRYKDSQGTPISFTNTMPDWKNKNYIYNEIPLQVILSDLQNEYSLAELQTGSVNLNATFTGRLLTDDLEKALQLICKPMNLNYTINKNKVTISEK